MSESGIDVARELLEEVLDEKDLEITHYPNSLRRSFRMRAHQCSCEGSFAALEKCVDGINDLVQPEPADPNCTKDLKVARLACNVLGRVRASQRGFNWQKIKYRLF